MSTATNGKRLRTIAELRDIHLGRTIALGELTGTLVGLIPVGNKVQARLIVGGSYVWTDSLDGGTHVEVWGKAS